MKKHDLFSTFWKSTVGIRKDTVNEVLKEISDEIRYFSTTVLPSSNGRQVKSILKRIESLRTQRENLIKWSKNYDEKKNPRAIREIEPEKQPVDTSELMFPGEDGETEKGNIGGPEDDMEESSFETKKLRKISQQEIVDNPERAYNRGVGISTIREALEEAGADDDEITEIIESFYKSKVKKESRQIYFEYLDNLRESGETNMFGASLYLQEEFGLERKESRDILAEWMRSFSQRHPEKSQIYKEYNIVAGDSSLANKRIIFKNLYSKAWGTLDGLNNAELEKMSVEELDKNIDALQAIYNE